MNLAALLFSQGFGTRRACAALVAAGEVRLGGVVVDDPGFDCGAPAGLQFEVQGRTWEYHAQAVLMLHKPAGYECSRKPGHWPSVLSLLPAPLRTRGVQPVGRLDQDTTGLLLLTDDGALIHRLTHPKRHVAKVYQVSCAEPVDEAQLQRLREGVQLHDDPQPVRAVQAEASGSHGLTLVLTEGRYHQVKRMVAAAGNQVAALHRSHYGGLALPADLAPGQWRWLSAAEQAEGLQPLPR